MANDFRDAAAEQSAELVQSDMRGNVLDSDSSLCIRLEGNPTFTMYRMALTPWLWFLPGAIGFLTGLICFVLILTPWLDATFWSMTIAIGGTIVGVILVLLSLTGEAAFDRGLVECLGARLKHLEGRVTERYPFAVENPATYKRLKFISEDYVTGGPDRRRGGLLLEGMRYRYVIRPNNVTEFRMDRRTMLISYRVGNAAVTLAISPLGGDFDEDDRIIATMTEMFGSAPAAQGAANEKQNVATHLPRI